VNLVIFSAPTRPKEVGRTSLRALLKSQNSEVLAQFVGQSWQK
jgi:hypothetical protein